MPRASAI